MAGRELLPAGLSVQAAHWGPGRGPGTAAARGQREEAQAEPGWGTQAGAED